MGLAHSPSIVTNGLVFAYDMGNTQKSFKGAPTTNLITNPRNLSDGRTAPADCGSSFTNFTTGGPTDGPFVRVTRVTTSTPLDWAWQISYPSIAIGTTFKFSCFARSINGSVSTIEFANPDAEEVSFALTPQWQRFSTTFTSGVQSNLQFMRINRSNANDKTIGSIYDVADAQIEVQSIVTPFVNGTRSNTQVVLDQTNNNTVTANSLTYASDGTFSFNASSDYMDLNTSMPSMVGDISYSLMAWVKINSNRPAGGVIVGSSSIVGHNNEFGFGLQIDTGNYVNFGLRSTGNYNGVTPLALNTWYHVAGVKNALGDSFIYVNGVQDATSAALGSVISTTTTIRVGYGPGRNPAPFDGSISQVQIYNRALTAAEVAQNFNAIRGRYGI